jgi:hypothetical protein
MQMEEKLEIPLVEDFRVTGDGRTPAWTKIAWHSLGRVGAGAATYATRYKAAWSPRGLYFLCDCEDRKLTCSDLPDFGDLFTEDVVELFLWPDDQQTLYFEYEISPLGAQLPILVSNDNGAFHGWMPWRYQGERRCQGDTTVRGGERAAGSAVTGWTAECFIPFALLHGVCPIPKVGDQWRANVYRIDYDALPESHWAWDARTNTNFHDCHRFGTWVFGGTSTKTMIENHRTLKGASA